MNGPKRSGNIQTPSGPAHLRWNGPVKTLEKYPPHPLKRTRTHSLSSFLLSPYPLPAKPRPRPRAPPMASSLPPTAAAARLAAQAFAFPSPRPSSASAALPRASAFPAVAVAAAPLRARRAQQQQLRPPAAAGGEQRETILLPGCDYNHWLIVMEFPKDPAPTREQMIDTYLNTLATVLGR